MRKEILSGIIAFFSLLLFYFIVMTIVSRSFSATIIQFKELWYLMMILSGGFGIQIGLFTHLHSLLLHDKIGSAQEQAKTITATSTGTSAVSMIACCAHHLTEVLPIIGLSGVAVFLTNYQIPLIILGIIMNVFGIGYMLRQIKKVKRHVN